MPDAQPLIMLIWKALNVKRSGITGRFLRATSASKAERPGQAPVSLSNSLWVGGFAPGAAESER